MCFGVVFTHFMVVGLTWWSSKWLNFLLSFAVKKLTKVDFHYVSKYWSSVLGYSHSLVTSKPIMFSGRAIKLEFRFVNRSIWWCGYVVNIVILCPKNIFWTSYNWDYSFKYLYLFVQKQFLKIFSEHLTTEIIHLNIYIYYSNHPRIGARVVIYLYRERVSDWLTDINYEDYSRCLTP